MSHPIICTDHIESQYYEEIIFIVIHITPSNDAHIPFFLFLFIFFASETPNSSDGFTLTLTFKLILKIVESSQDGQSSNMPIYMWMAWGSTIMDPTNYILTFHFSPLFGLFLHNSQFNTCEWPLARISFIFQSGKKIELLICPQLNYCVQFSSFKDVYYILRATCMFRVRTFRWVSNRLPRTCVEPGDVALAM